MYNGEYDCESQHQESYVENSSAQLCFIQCLCVAVCDDFSLVWLPFIFLHAYHFESSCNKCEKYPIINSQIAILCFS